MLILITEESPILITLVIFVGEKAWEERRKTVLWERERERGLGTSMGGWNKGMVQSDIMKEESTKKVEYDSQNGRK